MPARDLIHDAVVNALHAEEWRITHDPLYFQIDDEQFFIDIGAEQIVGAEKAGQKIAIEVKSFLSASFAADFHTAVGQFVNYRIALEIEEPERTLYLAVPLHIYNRFFGRTFMRTVVERQMIKLVVFDVSTEVIVEWIE